MRVEAGKDAEGGGGGGEAKLGLPMTKKKFAELELSLLQLQQYVEMPETNLVVHPVVQRGIELANDPTSLTSYQSSRDVSSGTASQGGNFWLSLESASGVIGEQLRSEEVGVVTDALRNAKRFRATVSSIGDRDATDFVHKQPTKKDSPLDDLLSSTDLDKIHELLTLIFSHLNRKLKLPSYPIRRALPLVEAISQDFNDVLLRVITSHRLAYTLPHLHQTSPRTNDGPGDIQDVG